MFLDENRLDQWHIVFLKKMGFIYAHCDFQCNLLLENRIPQDSCARKTRQYVGNMF
jgi:mannosyltransferase OCH1-like enzyme